MVNVDDDALGSYALSAPVRYVRVTEPAASKPIQTIDTDVVKQN